MQDSDHLNSVCCGLIVGLTAGTGSLWLASPPSDALAKLFEREFAVNQVTSVGRLDTNSDLLAQRVQVLSDEFFVTAEELQPLPDDLLCGLVMSAADLFGDKLFLLRRECHIHFLK